MNTITRIPRALPPPSVRIQTTRVLVCQTCGTWTPHALNASQTAYVCGCGEEVVLHINLSKPMYGVR